MGLKKQIETDYGVTANYWKIGKVDMVLNNDKCRIVLWGFASLSARRNKSRPLIELEFISDYLITDMASIYAWIKTQLPFTDATDDLSLQE